MNPVLVMVVEDTVPYITLSVKGDEVPEAMNVPAVTPEKESVWPTARAPDVVTDTVSVVPEMEPVTVAAAVPEGQ